MFHRLLTHNFFLSEHKLLARLALKFNLQISSNSRRFGSVSQNNIASLVLALLPLSGLADNEALTSQGLLIEDSITCVDIPEEFVSNETAADSPSCINMYVIPEPHQQEQLDPDEIDGYPVILYPDHKFSLSVHTWSQEELSCAKTVNQAQYRQDILMQFHSKAHFDNCDFSNAFSYLNQLHAEAKEAAIQGKTDLALTRIGQALHALQDFYAHSNYIELMEVTHENVPISSVPILRLWTAEGQQTVSLLAQQQSQALVSGYVWWGFPQQCPKGVMSHGQMAKDSSDPGTNGANLAIARWGGVTRHQAAWALALRESAAFLRATIASWPELSNKCGIALPLNPSRDRRRPINDTSHISSS